ncbi:Alpha-ketoglutarate-dependent sulfonate dioxygenase [Vanrija pseudolonga]|uniref:Alpha-ketoglutarate-dependent sulfonate dioxygenase n=1 Tax=Vanrija pseudolonga TaxID=143232 RepID=A0AAF1BQY7_9TREE|nr:Alpha-ketoglutarate-dependent sulfonate dioxygenase [Vanrija pseudolonga]
MAPIATATQPEAVAADLKKLAVTDLGATAAAKIPAGKWFSETGLPESEYPYKHLLPTWDQETKYVPLGDFEHVDPGHKAKDDADPRSFLKDATVDNLSPKFGTEVTGVQLSALDTHGREQLALFVAERGVVVFRDQDFIDQDPRWQVDNWGSFFGRNHIHPTSGQPKGAPELHLVYRAPDSDYNFPYKHKLNSKGWHSDVSYEKQPPGLTALFLYDSPPSGGDTLYLDQREAYNRLSPSFAAYLETLEVVHSGFEQAAYARSGERGPERTVRREPVKNTHPLVRRHPVTGEKALYVTRVFSRSIVGLKQEESDAILNLLYDHIENGIDFQVRARWKPRTVVLWDNRTTAHTAIADFDSTKAKRHGARITPQAERPFL